MARTPWGRHLTRGLRPLPGLVLLALGGLLLSSVPGGWTPSFHPLGVPPRSDRVAPDMVALARASLARGEGPTRGSAWECSSALPGASTCSSSPSPSIVGLTSRWVNMTNLSAPVPPINRDGGYLAWDAVDGYVLLLDCSGLSVGSGPVQTWTYSEGVWTELSPPVEPSWRWFASMAYDLQDGYVLLVGGEGTAGALGDAWKFTGGVWTSLGSAGPGPIWGAAMADDPADGYVLLVGGTASGYNPYSWAYSNGTWTQLVFSSPTPLRTGAQMVFDAADGYMLLVGGYNSATGYLSDSWGFSTRTAGWQPETSGVFSGREHVQLFYDPWDQKVVMNGGYGAGRFHNDTWYYTGGTWTNVTSYLGGTSPSLSGAATVVDPYATYPLMFGGTGTVASGATGFLNLTLGFEPPLNASASSSSPRVDVGAPLLFNGSWTGGSLPASGSWTFGDGTSAASAHPIHTFVAPGNYSTRFRVQDALGVWASAAWTQSVASAMSVSVGGGPRSEVGPFNASLTSWRHGGVGPVAYAWTFGDGGRATTSNSTHAYSTVGTYVARLWANDSGGGRAVLLENESVLGPLSVALALSANGTLPGVAVTLSATVGGGNGSDVLAWYLNSSPISGANALTFPFTPGGAADYDFQVVARDAAGDTTSAARTLHVIPFPSPFEVRVALSSGLVSVGSSVEATAVLLNASAGPRAYAWGLNASTPLAGTGSSINLTFAHGGAYTINISVIIAGSARAGAGQGLVVFGPGAPAPLVASDRASATTVTAGGNVSLSSSASGGVAPYAFLWSLNGTNTTVATATWTLDLEHPGTYTLRAWVRDAAGTVGGAPWLTVQVAAGTPSPRQTSPVGPTLPWYESLDVFLGLTATVAVLALLLLLTFNRMVVRGYDRGHRLHRGEATSPAPRPEPTAGPADASPEPSEDSAEKDPAHDKGAGPDAK